MKTIFILLTFVLFYPVSLPKLNAQTVARDSVIYAVQDSIYTTIDQLPEYSDGGNDAFYTLIVNNIDLEKDEYIQQPRSKLILTIDDRGEVLSFQFEDNITRKIKQKEEYSLLDKQIVQSLRLSKKWIPAKCNNQNVTTILVFSFSAPRFK